MEWVRTDSHETYAHLDGEMVYLRRPVDHECEVLKSSTLRPGDEEAALRFCKMALTRHGSPEAIIADGLRSYGAATM